MKKKKNMIPFAIVLTISLFSFRPYLQKTGNALLLGSELGMNISTLFEEEGEGNGTITTKLYVKPNPPKEDILQKRRQDELLAVYHQ